MATFENWGDYWWPGQLDECRRNKLDIHNPAELQLEERLRSGLAAADIVFAKVSVEQTFDLEHIKAIHAHLFGEVYEWAGQIRADELQRPDQDPNQPGHAFMPKDAIEPQSAALFAMLEPGRLGELDRVDQVERLAQLYNAVNVIHPFFDGNGRTNRLFLADVAAAADLAIDWSRFADQNAVMAQAFETGPAVIAEALAGCIVERDIDPQRFAVARASVLTVASTEAQAGLGTHTAPALGDAQLDPELEEIKRIMGASFPTPASDITKSPAPGTGRAAGAAADGEVIHHGRTGREGPHNDQGVSL